MRIKLDIQTLKVFYTKNLKVIKLLLYGLLAVFIILISFYAYILYKSSLSVETRVEKIKQSVTAVSFEDLTNFIDFRQLSSKMADQLVLNPKTKIAANTNPAIISETIQNALLELLNTKDQDGEKPEVTIFHPLLPLPDDFFQQFTSTLKIVENNDNEAVIEANINCIRTNTNVTLKLQMENTPSYGWRITKILNGEQLIEQFYQAKQILRNQVINFITENNNLILKEMDKYFTLESCSAEISTISSSNVQLLSIEIKGYNNGPYIIHNFNINTDYYNSTTKEKVTDFSLNLARRSFPNDEFRNTWHLDIDPENPKHKLLMDNLPLSCTAQFNNMVLSSGKALYLREIPEEH